MDTPQNDARTQANGARKQESTEGQKLFTPLEAWNYSGKKIGRDTFYAMLHSGQLKSIKVGRRFVIPRSSLEAFLEGHQ